ncbi:MAG: family metalloprotease protein [Rhizorhabdus sp.]|nr:family metalloprotease protein [Rhizorhabdus sp.]
MDDRQFLQNYLQIFRAAHESDDGERCAVPASPEARDKLKAALKAVRDSGALPAGLTLKASEITAPGLNDGVIFPPDAFPLGTAPSVIRSAAADRAPLQGVVRVIVVLVDFTDKHMTQTQQHYKDLFFKQGGAQKSVREYYAEVTNGLVDIQGDVVGPFRLPQTLAAYAHGASGLGGAAPNAQTMAKDALLAANPTVNFTPYDNDGNGYVDAFIVIHAGTGAETNNNPGDIWSHKWTIAGGAQTVDSTKVYAYLTVPEDCRIGVCAHELGHLLFGFPDLYDTDGSSEGIGNWCLMGAGSWGGGGNKPVHPSAWCKANQGWVSVDNRTANGNVAVQDVKASHKVQRLWKDGAPGKEYFLVENRQATGDFDVSLPGSGLLIWHVDENQTSNKDENHYWVALMQADGKRDMELNQNRGDGGDCYPGTSNNTSFNNSSTPNSKSYAGASTCVAVTGIPAPAAVMNVGMQVKCSVKPIKEITKEIINDKHIQIEKPLIREKIVDKQISADKRPDKSWVEGKFADKLNEGRPGDLGGGGIRPGGVSNEELLARISALEAALAGTGGAGPFIGNELRPDLSQGALAGEDDHEGLNADMAAGSGAAKRHFDTLR